MRFAFLSAAAVGVILACASSVFADQTVSSNWSGYAIHRKGTRFTRVAASWRQPRVRCRRGHRSYSAMWVGLGGFASGSGALEQIGTELDCTRSGRSSSFAWLELIPAPSRSAHLQVRPGDLVAASVTVTGHQVTLALLNLTRHTSFRRTKYAQFIDVTSAEWILETPSICPGYRNCLSLPLANFGSARFAGATVQTTTGHAGTIFDPGWSRTKIRLRPGGRRFAVSHGSGSSAGGANPSALSRDGSSFRVTFASVRRR